MADPKLEFDPLENSLYNVQYNFLGSETNRSPFKWWSVLPISKSAQILFTSLNSNNTKNKEK